MSYGSERDEGRDRKPDEPKKNEPRKSYCGIPSKEPGDTKAVRIDFERQHRGKNGR